MRFLFFNLLACAFLYIAYIIGRAWFSPTHRKMNKFFFALVAILAVSCSKKTDTPAPQPPSKINVRFFSTNAVTSTKVITAKVNGTDYGTVRYSASQPACDAVGYGMVPLAPGNYTVDYIDKDNPMANRQVQITVVASTTCAFFNLK